MRILTLDFETKDPYIGLRLGSGWIYGTIDPVEKFKVLGCAIRDVDGFDYTSDWGEVESRINTADALVMHNAPYDLGCLHYLAAKGLIKLESFLDKRLFDTIIMAKLFDSTLLQYSLDTLSKKYLNKNKSNKELVDTAYDAGIYPWLKKELNAKAKAEKNGETYVRERPEDAKILKFVKTNMDILQDYCPEVLADYANMDTECTEDLFNFYKDKGVDMAVAEKYSFMSHVCCDYRKKGVRVDLEKARQVSAELEPIIAQHEQECYRIAGEEFNMRSPKDMPRVFDKLGIEYPLTPAGNPSMNAAFLNSHDHPLCREIVATRKVRKIKHDFIDKVIEMQDYTGESRTGQYGRIHPELHLLKARTGRFSCAAPNIQQIPARDKKLAPMCRSIFVPEEGDTWYSLDYSNQEGRLQVHYASKLHCEGAEELVLAFNKDPKLDLHQMVADVTGIPRNDVKGLNLGLSYGMGNKTMASMLDISLQQCMILREKYENLYPYLGSLSNICQEVIKNRGFIKTIGGRKLDNEKGDKDFSYKALNKLIQGSAADQTIEAMYIAYKEGLPVLFPVHDQLCLSGNAEQAKRLHEIMETCIDLCIPVVVDFEEDGGPCWAEAGH